MTQKERDKGGKTDLRLILSTEATIHTVVLQLTQSIGKAIIHFFITALALPFPCSKRLWIL